jgi:hypothetical protein
MRGCDEYKKSKKLAALGNKPKAGSTPSDQPPKSIEPDCIAPLREFEKAMHEFTIEQEAPQTPQQLRRSTLQAVKVRVIDQYQSSSGMVSSTMRGDAKMAIEQQLASVPLEEVPFHEACELGAAIRDRVYAPIFKKETEEAEQQQAEQESRRRKHTEETAAGHRAAGRKATLIEQAIGQARARCEAQQILGRDRLRVLVDIESRLNELLIGSESVPDAYAIIQTVAAVRFVEAEAKQEAARAKANERWYEEVAAVLVLGALVGLVVLALKYPAHTLAILNWIERTFDLAPGAEAGAPTRDMSETTPPAASAEARPRSTRRRKDSVAPSSAEPIWGHSVGPKGGHA